MCEELKEQITGVKQKTQKPFGVNIPLASPESDKLVQTSIEAGVTAIFTSAGSPKKFTPMIQEAGVKAVHVSPNAFLAEKAAKAGVDAVVVEGFEAGGHNGFEGITTMALVPQAAARVNIPVIAAGGIADSRGFIAAMALGAQGVQMGTRFAATYEAQGHPKFKEAIINADDISTVITGNKIGPTRAIRNQLSERILQAEGKGASAEEIIQLIGPGRSRMATIEGDIEEGSVYCGQIAGAIADLKTAKQVISMIIEDSKTLLQQLGDRYL